MSYSMEHLRVGCPICGRIESHAHPDEEDEKGAREDRERAMFGCTAAVIDTRLAGKEPRDIAMYAMGTLSDAQEIIHNSGGGAVGSRDADKIRQLMNIAKYAIDTAVPR